MKKITAKILGGANICLILMMLSSGYAGCLSPVDYPWVEVFGLGFPVFLAVNLVFIAVWMFLKPRYIIIPVAGIMCCVDLLNDYSPLNLSETHPDKSLKVVSYNVMGFGRGNGETKGGNDIVEFLIDSKADVLVIQEYAENDNMEGLRRLHELYPYVEKINAKDSPGFDCIAVMSKYPVKSKENLNIASKGNVAGVFRLNINGRRVTIINAHLETVGFSMEDKSKFSSIVHGKEKSDTVRTKSRQLFGKLSTASGIRASQADVLAGYIRDHKGESIIFAGDINDHPLSYTHRTIARELNDCYRMTGRLPGFSHNGQSMFVRIDAIMCSDDWQPYECHVDKTPKQSDHFPIICYFKQK